MGFNLRKEKMGFGIPKKIVGSIFVSIQECLVMREPAVCARAHSNVRNRDYRPFLNLTDDILKVSEPSDHSCGICLFWRKSTFTVKYEYLKIHNQPHVLGRKPSKWTKSDLSVPQMTSELGSERQVTFSDPKS